MVECQPPEEEEQKKPPEIIILEQPTDNGRGHDTRGAHYSILFGSKILTNTRLLENLCSSLEV